ncbi:hypothetical protein C8R43DRAFT_1141962 [Mycena crocata]|nr:hypothetical protein C8R43DRAFT_1141962 [Mycena crocata]
MSSSATPHVPRSHIQQCVSANIPEQPIRARLQTALLFARVRKFNRLQQQQQTELARVQALLVLSSAESASDDESDSGCSSDCGYSSSTSSRFTSYSAESQTSTASSEPAAMPKIVDAYVTPPSRQQTSSRGPVRVDHTKKHTTTYLYEGGVTRVLSGGVMLGLQPAVEASRA